MPILLQCFFKSTALCIGTVQDSKIFIGKMIAEFLFLYGVGHKFSFIIIRHGAHQPDFFPFCIFSKQYFFDLSFIIFDNFIGYMQYTFACCGNSVPASPLLPHHNLSGIVICSGSLPHGNE